MRLFFALWPDEHVRRQIEVINRQLAINNKGKAVSPENFHMTLAFLGNTSESQYDCITRQAAMIGFGAFDLCLDHIGLFVKAGVSWIGPSANNPEVNELASALQQLSQHCGVKIDKRFRPHVTLMRKTRCLQGISINPVEWHIEDFCLVQSLTCSKGVEYRPLQYFAAQTL